VYFVQEVVGVFVRFCFPSALTFRFANPTHVTPGSEEFTYILLTANKTVETLQRKYKIFYDTGPDYRLHPEDFWPDLKRRSTSLDALGWPLHHVIRLSPIAYPDSRALEKEWQALRSVRRVCVVTDTVYLLDEDHGIGRWSGIDQAGGSRGTGRLCIGWLIQQK
jgi:hypothetical protein